MSIEDIKENILLRESHARQREALISRFPTLSSCSHGHFLSLDKYLNRIPQKFFVEAVFQEYLLWMDNIDKKNRALLQAYLSDHAVELDGALHHLEEINAYDWHDFFEKLDDYETIRFIDQRVHPTYLRLAEAVFCPILRLVAHFSRIDRSKGTEGLDLWSIIQELQGRRFDEAIQSYHHIVRNGISHGGVIYLENAIRYRDKNGNEEEFQASTITSICDDLLDTCNALALAFSIFLLARQPCGYELPKQLLIEELRTETRSPWWEIVGCIPSQLSNINQLIIYARPSTPDYRKVLLSTFQSGVLAEQFSRNCSRG